MRQAFLSSTFFAALALTTTMVGLGSMNAPAFAQNAPTPRIVVSGTGTVDVAPDMAVLSLSVVRQAETARAALDANNEAMEGVLSAMQAEGIESSDMQTSNFSIQPRYERVNNNSGTRKDPEIIGYDVFNTLTVRVRDLTSLGRVLDKSVSLGVNSGGNIIFTNDDPSAAIEEARIKAMQAAMRKADVMTSTAGVGLGEILEITERSASPQPQPIARATAMVASAASVPIATGENSYSVTVNIIYTLDQ
ncbi:MAG: SIMPL domain-containing protein [Pseudomonadota bacterium]